MKKRIVKKIEINPYTNVHTTKAMVTIVTENDDKVGTDWNCITISVNKFDADRFASVPNTIDNR